MILTPTLFNVIVYYLQGTAQCALLSLAEQYTVGALVCLFCT